MVLQKVDSKEFIIPEPRADVSSEFVLVTHYVGGETLLAFKKRHESDRQDKINDMACHIMRFHVMSSVEGYVYADFHWGNLKVVNDTQLCVLDYGMVDELVPGDVPPYLKMQLFAILRDKEHFLKVLRTEQPCLQKFEKEVWELYELSTEPYRATAGFTYTQSYVDTMSTKLTSFRSDLPDGCLCVMRAELLLCNVFVYMQATIPRRQYEWVIRTYIQHLSTDSQPYFRGRFKDIDLLQ
jgi:predicted unusual protein kinase regulating ubiquinone biosynthesis (AarF/ABC1/UbiB family)